LRAAIVIAGGWSVSQYDAADLRGPERIVIGVNESSVLAQCDVGITMDRLWAEHRWERYFATRAGDLWIRRGADKALPEHPKRRQFECDNESFEMSDEPNVLNGTNSGMCALNYAFKLRPQAVYLFGFDMQRGPNGKPYWHKPYEWRPEGATKPGTYRDWVPQFESIARQFRERGITVKQVNNRSKIRAFEQIDYKRFVSEVA
jgi:hypothetical protein